MPPKKPRPADTGGVTKPMRTGTLTGETPVKEHIEKIEKNGGKEPPIVNHKHLFIESFNCFGFSFWLVLQRSAQCLL